MTPRQAILKSVYPLLSFINKLFKMNTQVKNSSIPALRSFYDLKMTQNNGEMLDFKMLKNKKILIVNTASDCAYTNQYEGLQKMYEENKDHLLVIGFPSNDFGEQEKGNDITIEEFCKINFGVTFPLMMKSTVIKNDDQNEVFHWLTNKDMNGWNEKAPSWNFCKYVIDEKGNLTHFFEAAFEPSDSKLVLAIS